MLSVTPGPTQREFHVRFPDRFSFIENPKDAIATVRRLVQAAVTSKISIINIDQSRCTLIDHGAESVISALGIEATKSLPIRFRGGFPHSLRERLIVLATGLPKALGVPLPEPDGFLTFPLRMGRKGTASGHTSQLSEIVATDIAQYMNRCLKNYGLALNPRGALYLTALVGEVLGNAEDHSGRRHWWVSGYLRQPPGMSYGDCHISIFSFGRSIAESMQELPPDSLLYKEVERLIAKHKGRALFSTKKWEPENLRTVYALQEGVSRHNTGTESLGHRGKGTADLIEFFHRLGQSTDQVANPRMCFVSGRTHIVFDGKYQMREMPFHDGTARVIAFNKQNDLSHLPDSDAVKWLDRPFPGTLISLKFYIDPAYLQRR